MERVAEEACVSKQTLYNQFADKEELFGAVLEAYDSRAGHDEALVAALLDAGTGDPVAALQRAAVALFDRAADAEYVALHRIMVEIAAELPEVMTRMRQRVFLQSVAAVRAALERGAAAGALRPVDAEAVAYVLFGVAAAFGLFRPRSPDALTGQLTPERMAAALADLLAQGLLARRSAPADAGANYSKRKIRPACWGSG